MIRLAATRSRRGSPAWTTGWLRNTRDVDLLVHLLDMIETVQLDPSWLARVPVSLRQRLQDPLDDPDG